MTRICLTLNWRHPQGAQKISLFVFEFRCSNHSNLGQLPFTGQSLVNDLLNSVRIEQPVYGYRSCLPETMGPGGSLVLDSGVPFQRIVNHVGGCRDVEADTRRVRIQNEGTRALLLGQ